MKRLYALLLLLTVTPAWADGNDPSTLRNSIDMPLKLIPAGEFVMGSPSNEIGRYAAEQQHPVRITKPFHIGVYEVTQEEFQTVIGRNPSYYSAAGQGQSAVEGLETKRFPVESISWEEAVEFCQKLSELPQEKAAGHIYRLPTEAEWEYACRAGSSAAFYFGDRLSSVYANFDGNHPYLSPDEVQKGADPAILRGAYLKRPSIVGTYRPNAFGLYDTHGNVWEWCSDWYSPVYYKDSPADDPKGPEAGTHKVSRGGGWYYFAAGCRSASRYERLPAERRNTDGFRVVCEVAQPPAAAAAASQ